jgi:ketosteroid isomerase-like protein
MRRYAPILFLALLLQAGFNPRPACAQSKEEQAIRAVIDCNVQAYNSVDPKVVMQSMVDVAGGPFYPPFAPSAATPADLEPLLTRILDAASSRTFAVTGPIQIKAEKKLGWANYSWHAEVTFRDGTKRGFDGRTTAAFELQGKAWKYVHWHSSLATPFPKTSKELEADGQAIIQVERNAWEAFKSKNLPAMQDYYADGATAFSDDQAYRIKGKADILSAKEASMKQSDLLSYKMLDPQVQVLGDTAVLTYYFTESSMEGGKASNHAGKISMVFVKQDGKWRALHEHVAANLRAGR